MKEDITNVNSKEQYHGYQERYWGELRNKLYYRANWRYDCCIGYEEYHSGNGETNLYSETNLYIR